MPRLTRRARKDLDRLPSALAAKAYEITKRLDDEPAPRKNLLGPLKRKRSTRLGRSHRIIYTITEDGVVVLTIVARKDVYR